MNGKNKKQSEIQKRELLEKALANFCELSEEDFYPPEDKRLYQTGMQSTRYDSYDEYVQWFYETYEEELFDN